MVTDFGGIYTDIPPPSLRPWMRSSTSVTLQASLQDRALVTVEGE